MLDLEQSAKEFATRKHAEVNQVRKYTGGPYINHPAAVVEIIRSVPHTNTMLAAAWLHDTVEDTNTTLEEIKKIFGSGVGMLVGMLTDVSTPEDGNRKYRKTIDRMHTSLSSPPAMTIKLADMIDNSASILKYDPRFAKIYIEERRLLLEVLKDGSDDLWYMADNVVKNAIK